MITKDKLLKKVSLNRLIEEFKTHFEDNPLINELFVLLSRNRLRKWLIEKFIDKFTIKELYEIFIKNEEVLF